jgi:hypothetical protein
MADLTYKEAKDLKILDELYNGIVYEINEGIFEDVYDVINVEETNNFYTNGFIVHNCLYIDEYALIPKTIAEDFLTSTLPTIFSGKTSKIMITSTPLGYNHFYDLWDGAEKGINGYIPIKVEWFENPNRDEKWLEEQKKILKNDQKVQQEIFCSFLGSTNTLISPEFYSKMNPVLPIHQKDGFTILQETIVGHRYTCICDIAKGVGKDFSTIVVLDTTCIPYKTVAKYKNNQISDILFPDVIYKIGTMYNNADVLIEINTSEDVARTLYNELEYENVIMVSRSPKRGQYVGQGFGGSGSSRLGVQTDKKIKRIGCSNLKSLIEEKKLIVEDADIISEISTFIEKGTSFAAEDGYNDDLVMCLVLFGWLTTQTWFSENSNEDFRKQMSEKYAKELEEMMLPTGGISNGLSTEGVEVVYDF